MTTLTYTASELLAMHHVPAKHDLLLQLQNKLRKDLDLGDVVRLSSHGLFPVIEEETTEELSNTETDTEPASVQQLDGADCEWKYRGRDPSEASEPQPISAPVGLAAQQSEGFQRFYKAVVSPTHVRVTAGGRIVPNTRGSCSPTAKWTKEKVAFEDLSGKHQHQDASDPSMLPMSGIPFAPMHPMIPGFFPHALTHGMQHPHAFPMNPWHLGFNGFNIPTPFAPPPGAVPIPPNSRLASMDSSKAANDGTGRGNAENTNPVRISPPEQFDHSRPFFYNGQWIMPPSPYFAYGMHGVAAMGGLSPSAMFNHTAAPTSKSSVSPVTTPKASKQERNTDGNSTAGASATASHGTPNMISKSQPPISSIRPSEITKKQIDVLRGSLRYLEDQLQYNKHQIDEKWMEHQAHIVRQQIEQFEKNFDSQCKFEVSHYPPKNPHEKSVASSDGNGKSLFIASSDEKDSGHGTSNESFHRRGKLLSVKSSTQLKSKSSFSGDRGALAANSSRNETQKHMRSTTLPMHAAMAPPFQPRQDITTPTSIRSEYSGDDVPKSLGSVRGASSRRERKLNKPYLVGKLPAGVTRTHAQEVDYTYARDLTEDELRARHMYWGKAPRHLQRGLPKFDGKDFYPPSPDRRASTDTGSSQGESASQSPTSKVPLDPFRSLGRRSRPVVRLGPGKSTQSESLIRSEDRELSDTMESPVIRSESAQIQAGHSYSDFRSALGASSVAESDVSQGRTSSDEGEDEKSLLFKGRKSMNRTGTKARNEIWQNMLRKGKSSANAVPGTVSSTTVQGVLPQYAGHAAAYLTPTLANTSLSPRASPKTGQVGSSSLTGSDKGENMPPCDVADDKALNKPEFSKMILT